jgi:hypothetical protein
LGAEKLPQEKLGTLHTISWHFKANIFVGHIRRNFRPELKNGKLFNYIIFFQMDAVQVKKKITAWFSNN